MKTLEEYRKLSYRLELIPDPDEGGFVACYPELKGCLSSGETAESALRNAEEARLEWLSAAIESGVEIPMPKNEEDYSGQFRLRMPKSLHHLLALQARRDGVSLNQYCVHLLSQSSANRL